MRFGHLLMPSGENSFFILSQRIQRGDDDRGVSRENDSFFLIFATWAILPGLRSIHKGRTFYLSALAFFKFAFHETDFWTWFLPFSNLIFAVCVACKIRVHPRWVFKLNFSKIKCRSIKGLSLSIFSVRKLLKILLVRPVMRLILRRAGQGGSSSRSDFSILAQLEIQ